MDEKELQALYNAMSNKFDVGDFNAFKSKMQTPDDRKKFYDVVSSKGLDLGDYNQYETRIGGVKKKMVATIYKLKSQSKPTKQFYKYPLPMALLHKHYLYR